MSLYDILIYTYLIVIFIIQILYNNKTLSYLSEENTNQGIIYM